MHIENAPEKYLELLEEFTNRSREILGETLTGIYLHGSAAMGCFSERSDIDLLIVVKEELSFGVKKRYMDMVIEIDERAPRKGLELSVVKESSCKPFIYPTPYELHFSRSHLDWYESDPDGYIESMKGTDKDLAAHCMIINKRGRALYGKDIGDVFGEVRGEYYLDSILYDISGVKEEIAGNPVSCILNLCRVLAYAEGGNIYSKAEGGEWGIRNVPEKYDKLISGALLEYKTGKSGSYGAALGQEFAEYMEKRIGGKNGKH